MMTTPFERQRAQRLAELTELARNEPHIRESLERMARSGARSGFDMRSNFDSIPTREPSTMLGGFMLMWLATIVHGGKTIWRAA